MDSRQPRDDAGQTRFDDRVKTVIAGLAGDVPARVAAWRQAIDLLCQPGLSPDDADLLLDAAIGAYDAVPPETRREAARVAAFGSPPAELAVRLANDRPFVAIDLLTSVILSPEAWRDILPRLSPVARGILRARRDLDGATRAALASFGPVDFVLSGTTDSTAEATPVAGLSRIADLVARIEAYRQTRRSPAETPPPDQLAEFRFETDAGGVIRWVDAADRAALVGLSLAVVAEGPGPGVDAAAMGALRRRSAFRDARMIVGSDTPAGGEWRISAAPVFDDVSGRLAGYRGQAMRAAPHQRAEAMAGRGLSADSLRQLVHELRTPLNAIGGFSELIERQLMGPVAESYRTVAADIGLQARTLIEAIDDLDTAARLDGRSLVLSDELVVLGDVVARAVARYAPVTEAEGAAVHVDGTGGAVLIAADARAVDRLVTRLLGTVLPLAVAGETIRISLDADHDEARVVVERPSAPEPDDAGLYDSALLLGLDFAMRLIRNLARAMGGALHGEGRRLTLSLPVGATRPAEEHGG